MTTHREAALEQELGRVLNAMASLYREAAKGDLDALRCQLDRIGVRAAAVLASDALASPSPEPGLMVPVAELMKFSNELVTIGWRERGGLRADVVNRLDSLIASAVPSGDERLREAGYQVVAAWATEGNHGLQDAINKLAALVLPRTALSQQHTEE